MLVVGLCGAAGCGKSTVAEWLERERGFARLRFADPLKAMLRAYYGCLGVSPAAIEARIEGDLKARDDNLLCGASPRRAMQTLGTEWGRGLIHEDLWTEAWLLRVEWASRVNCDGVVVEDVRFPNEVAALREVGGVLVRIVRPGQDEVRGGVPGHPSEGQPLSSDRTLLNKGPRDGLGAAVWGALGD